MIAGGRGGITPRASAGCRDARAFHAQRRSAHASRPFDKDRAVRDGRGIRICIGDLDSATQRGAQFILRSPIGLTSDAYTSRTPERRTAPSVHEMALRKAASTAQVDYITRMWTSTPINDPPETRA